VSFRFQYAAQVVATAAAAADDLAHFLKARERLVVRAAQRPLFLARIADRSRVVRAGGEQTGDE
jgi:hypothetical protein